MAIQRSGPLKILLGAVWDAVLAQGTADVVEDFLDATTHAEFLYGCVHRTIQKDLPYETDFLRRYDRFREQVETIVDMPDRTIDLLFRFLRQNQGSLSQRARAREFDELTTAEADRMEELYREICGELDE